MQTQADYRDTLRQELIDRCDKNPRYSLRGFARDIGLEPARLSDILNGKKGLSREVAQAISKRLGLTQREEEFFCTSVEALHSRSKAARIAASIRLENQRQKKHSGPTIDADDFKVVSDWYHLAILQLLKIPRAESDASWIAKCFGLKTLQVTEALRRMQRLGMIKREGYQLKATDEWVFTTDGVPSDAIKRYHEQILQKAIAALYSQPLTERSIRAITIPLAIKDVDRARKKIKDFLADLSDELSASVDCDAVYCLSTQLFNLTPALKERSLS